MKIYHYIIISGLVFSLCSPLAQAASQEATYLVQYADQERPVLVKAADLPAALQKNGLRYAERNVSFQAALTPTDSQLAKQWYLNKIHAKEAWNIRHDAQNITVAILDSGVDLEHPDLSSNIWRNTDELPNNGLDDDGNGFIDDVQGWNFVDNNNDPRPKLEGDFTADALHGTIVAGIIGAEGNNYQGIAGLAWKVQLLPLTVLDNDGAGSAADVQRAIDYAIDNHANIINLSFIGQEYSQALYEAIRRAHDAGVIVVAAAGNNSQNSVGYSLDKKPLYPICMDGAPGENLVVGVAATDAIDQRASFSGYGKNCIDISAPGISVFSTSVYRPKISLHGEPLNQYYDGYWSGTSVAAPMVSGALALIKSVNPELNRQEVIDVLVRNAENINQLNSGMAGLLGTGRLNIEAALIDAKMRQSQTENDLLAAPVDGSSLIRTFDSSGKLLGQFEAFAKFKGGVNVAVGDVDGDRQSEIIVVPAKNGGPQVKIFNRRGHLKNSFWAYEQSYRGGLSLAVGYLDNSQQARIVVGPAGSRLPEVKVFDYLGKRKAGFLAYDKKFRSGLNLALYDIDNDESNEIVTAPAKATGARILFFKPTGQSMGDFWPLGRTARQGLRLAQGDFSGRSFDRERSLIVMPNSPGGDAYIFSRSLKLQKKIKLAQFNPAVSGQLAVADFNRDGLDELAVSAVTKKGVDVGIYNFSGRIVLSFTVLPINYRQGANLAFIKK